MDFLLSSLFLNPGFDWGKNIVIFGVDNSSSVHIDNTKKDILVLGEGPAQALDGITIMTEAKISTNFSRSQLKFCLNLHYNGSKSFLFFNALKIYHFKAKDFEEKSYPLCLGNISKGFTTNNLKKAWINGYVYDF